MSAETQKEKMKISFPVEILHNIFQYLEKDTRTLYSCIRVNRFLCKQVIPYIWSNPMPNTYSSIPIEIFIYFFEEREKISLKQQHELDISYIPLFNYISYLKVLDLRGVRRAIFYWLKNYYVEKFPYSDIYVDFRNNQIIDFIETSLLRLILKNSLTVEKLILDLAEKYQDIPNYKIFLNEQQERGGIKEIKKLSILNSSVGQFENIQAFLNILPNICRNIQRIKLYDIFFIDPNMELKLCNVIKQQRQLTSINLTYNFVNILRMISALEYHAGSLKKLVLKYIYHNDILLFNIFDQLVNLEYLEIDECFPIKILLEPLIRANPKLVTLKINDSEGRYDLIESIIKSSKSTLRQLELYIYLDIIEDKSPLSELCPNLTYLSLKVNNRVAILDDSKVRKQDIFFNYINNLNYLKMFYLECFLYFTIKFDQLINLPSLQLISLKDQNYSLNSLEIRFNYFSKIFNNITFHINDELVDVDNMNRLENFSQEKKKYGFSLVYALDGSYRFVATDRTISY